ncbi:hypothetical protein [Flavobacterium sp. KACC 22761]|uniref:hypothetical protein n=1 Tax=Flavobacterium sp. KACC 22761 TaxID=3092665 RepID=UPI002A7481D8|nr:hypothetical protein [Flavobacterium sp. KACC 22761]WPO78240.1 hypothetical protein SCB73_18415 [Flavobacterium sp. KACC 22761]
MKKKESINDFYKEIFLKFNLNEINSFDHIVLRMEVPETVIKPKDILWKIYFLPDDKKNKMNYKDNSASGILLSTLKGQKSGWIEWKIDANQLRKLSKNKILSLKIIAVHYLKPPSSSHLIKAEIQF